ncbi:penicillin acylase family protein [Variovorax sp. RCC_210]|uniref:penicillin acylase family protein n=1 Tax=Variovorax sp. RCC_210 TaxID=3239217 RepID=UPI003525C87A
MTNAARQQLPGLRAPVDLWRDAWGIPHLRATCADDAFFALGHVHASDRLWQMDALRRRTLGRYAEWMGPSALPMDMLVRRLGLAECSRRDLEAVNERTRAMLSAYTAGVNAFMAAGPLPPEYALLGEAPEPWEAWHSIAVLRQTSLLLNSVYPKLWRAIALPVVGAQALDRLRMDDGGEELVCMPPGALAGRLSPDMAALADAISAFVSESNTDAAGGGSNNWAVHGSRTQSGRPLLAGDPHRVLDMPNMYLQCHVACDEFDVIGLTTPGVPGFPHFAHNPDVAWCVTVAFVDTADVYLERFENEGRRYLLRTEADGGHAQWAEVERRVERIRVRGQADVACEVLATARGPVVAGDAKSGSALVLRHSSDVEADRSFDCMRPMMEARSVDALFEASRGWGLVDHNLVAADTQGHIGHHVRAKVPRRPAINGWLPVPGWLDKHAWRGWIEWEHMPRQIDPPAGLIVTANNRVVERHDDYLSTDCHPPHRARRIWQLLTAMESAGVQDMEAVHRDTLSLPALEICARLAPLALTEPASVALRDRLVAWNGRVDADAVDANAYISLRMALARSVARRSGLGALDMGLQRTIAPGLAVDYQLGWCVPQLLRADDEALLGGASWNEVLTEALAEVARDPAAPWGARHRLLLRHPLAMAFPSAALLAPLDKGAVDGDNETVFTTGYLPHLGAHAHYASLARYVFDVGQWDACLWIVFHGASGDPRDAHYDDQTAAWLRGETVPMLYDWAAVADTASSHTVLAPR